MTESGEADAEVHATYGMSREGLYTSPLNSLPEVRGQFRFASDVIVNDCTLREGEQASEVSFSVDEKVSIATALAEAGVKQIEGGYPGRSSIDGAAIRRMKREGLQVAIEAIAQIFGPDWKDQVDRAVDSEADIVTLIYPSSDIRLKYVQQCTREEMLERAVEACRYAGRQGVLVRMSTTDTFRTDPAFLKEVLTETVAAGADRVTLSDTAGSAHPAAVQYLVSRVRSWVDVPVHVHFHNDFGLALANTVAAAEAGATVLDATLLGLGERSGNPSLDELVATLTFLYGLDLGIDTAAVGRISKQVAVQAGIQIPPSKPFIGAHAFAHKIDAHVDGMLRFAGTYEPIDPEWVGGERSFPVGKYSGPAVLSARLQQLGLHLPDAHLSALARAVEEEAVRKKGQLLDAEIVRLAERHLGS